LEKQPDGRATVAADGSLEVPALEPPERRKTMSRMSGGHDVHANLKRAWNRQLLECSF